MVRKLAIYGLSGAGKSTTCEIVCDACRARGLTVRVEKLAAPLYRLQADIYRLVGRTVEPGQQDQELLRTLAGQLRRIEPTFLVDDFLRRTHDTDADVIVNDDIKDTVVDYPALVEDGFRFLHVTCPDEIRAQRLTTRADLTQAAETAHTWRLDRIEPDWVLHNSTNDCRRLRFAVDPIVGEWLP